VGGVEVDADRLAADLAQAPERLGVVGDEAGVELDRDADAVVLGEGAASFQYGRDLLRPLPVEDVAEVGSARGR
jgi:cyanophycinase-like exopeptidase